MNSTISWLYHVSGKKKGYILALTFIQAVQGFIGVLYALLLQNIVDSAVDHDTAAFRHYVLMIILLVSFQLGVSALIRWLQELAKSDMENLFKQRLTDNILRKKYASVSATHTAEWMNRLTNDTTVVANGAVEILPGLTGMIVRMLSALIIIIALAPWFAYILIPGGLLLIILSYAFRKIMKRLHKNIQESDGKLRIFLQERIGSLMVIKAFTAEKQTSSGTAAAMEIHKASRMKRSLFSNLANTGFGAAMYGMYLTGVIYCAHGILSGTISYGTLTAVIHLIGQIQTPFANISGYLPRWYAMTASAERLMEIETFSEDKSPKSTEEIAHFYRDSFTAVGLRNIRFTYETADSDPSPVLKNLSLEIRKGEYIAFTGHSGCGKSTVLKLLMCMYQQEQGSLYIASKEGEYPLDSSWRRLFAYVPQGNVLMQGTIREIVSFADPSGAIDESRLKHALTISCADEFVEDIDMILGEHGTGLSEGQMQRIAIARAIFADSPILLLDESTSALDEKTESRLLENLRRMTDRTVIIVTHRKAALSICDRVLRFTENGVKEV